MTSVSVAYRNQENSLNLVRLLAALAVVYGHAMAITSNGPPDVILQLIGYKFIGGVAVDVFFIISGFLITASICSGKGYLYYLVSRVLRIFPALIFCVSVTVFLLGPLFTSDSNYWSEYQTWDYLWENATAYGTEYFLPGVFLDHPNKGVNGSLWSLPVEVRMYGFVFLMSVLAVFKKKEYANVLFFVALIVGFFFPNLFLSILKHENHVHVAMMFLFGSFYWVNREDIKLSPLVALVFLILCGATIRTPAFGFAYALSLPYFVLYIALGAWGKWYNRFGDYSYGVYLYGWISQQLVFHFFPLLSNAIHVMLASVLSLVFAGFSWNFIEEPFLEIKRRFFFSS